MEQATELLEEEFPNQSSLLVFKNRSLPELYSFSDFGLDYQASSSAVLAVRVARSGNLLQDLKSEWQAWSRGVQISPFYRMEDVKFLKTIATISSENSEEAKDAEYYWEGNELKIASESSGIVVDEQELNKEVRKRVELKTRLPIPMPYREKIPQISAAELEEIVEREKERFENPPTLTYGSRRWKPTREQMLSFVTYTGNNSGLQVSIKEKELSNYVYNVAQSINRPSKGGVFNLADGKVVEFDLAQDGLKVDQQKLLKNLEKAILEKQSSVNVPVVVTPAPEFNNDYGIQHLLSTGDSNFRGSGAGRIHNISVASSRLSGILIPPGEEFSFNENLGEVSAETGYQSAWIIKGGRTILGTGGGVCQVSTTLFRAALNAGLPILKRSAHAYRVHYYEPPVGFDATVYSPSPDLVFKNDTPAHILLKSFMNTAASSLSFKIYGTNDGRQVKITGPRIYNEVPPPEPVYQEDDSLPKGTTKQVDWAAWGADVTFWRKVTRGSEILQQDVFNSHYQSWQAVYLVGTGE